MADIGCRYDRADLLKALADRKGMRPADLFRSLCDAALAAEGFPIADRQYCLVRDGELIDTSFKPSKEPDGGEWLPIENEDNQPFDPALHYRLKPLPLRLDSARGIVVRTFPIVAKASMEHA